MSDTNDLSGQEVTGEKKNPVLAFLHRKGITLSPRVYFVDAMGVMAMGLFASLLMGTIFGTLAKYIGWSVLSTMASYAKAATGAVLGIAVAYALKAPPLVLFSAGAVGLCANDMTTLIHHLADGMEKSVAAGPAGAFLCALVAVELGKIVSKETKIDILVTPVVTIASGVGIAALICPGIAHAVYWIGHFINFATDMMPLLMGIVISVVVGIILTLPISSAAICAMIGITGLAGGAATAGCCAQMIGFAVISFRENRWGGVVAQGLGTSMLQMGNIVKNPLIWIPVTLASAITGPISTCLFKLECTGVNAGMGTCGLVGPLGILDAMADPATGAVSARVIIGILVVCFVLPAVLSLLISEGMRKLGWIRENDLKLEL